MKRKIIQQPPTTHSLQERTHTPRSPVTPFLPRNWQPHRAKPPASVVRALHVLILLCVRGIPVRRVHGPHTPPPPPLPPLYRRVLAAPIPSTQPNLAKSCYQSRLPPPPFCFLPPLFLVAPTASRPPKAALLIPSYIPPPSPNFLPSTPPPLIIMVFFFEAFPPHQIAAPVPCLLCTHTQPHTRVLPHPTSGTHTHRSVPSFLNYVNHKKKVLLHFSPHFS